MLSSSPVLVADSARRQSSPAATPAVSPIRSRSQSQSSSPVLCPVQHCSRGCAGGACGACGAGDAEIISDGEGDAEIISGGAAGAAGAAGAGGVGGVGGTAGVVPLVLASRLAAAAPPANGANSWTTVCPLRLCAPDERGCRELATSHAVSPQHSSPASQPEANGAAAAAAVAAAAAASAGPLPAAGAVASAIAASNLLVLVLQCTHLAGLNAQLLSGVPRNARDALDLAGKLPLALKANAIGIPPEQLNIDPAQAGGLLGKCDACVGRDEGVEIKGARCYRGSESFQFSRLRPGTPFKHLLFVARKGNPTNWTDMSELNNLFWLGHVSRADFDRALEARGKAGAVADEEVKANVTIGSRRRSWLGDYIQWVSFSRLDRAWWNRHVLGRI